MSDEITLDEFTQDEAGTIGKEGGEGVAVGEWQQLEDSPIASWKLAKLGDILTLEYGDNLPSDSRETGNIPVFGSNGQVDTHSEAAVERPGIVVGRKGSIGELEFSDKPFWPIDTTYYITNKETDQNLRFLYYLLQNIQLERLNAASAIPGLNRNDVYGLNAIVPPPEEQRKIATVLYTIDQAIENAKKIINQVGRIKKGLIQEFYSEGYYNHEEWQEVDKQGAYVMTRADEVPAEWDIRQSGKISEVKTGHTPSTSVDEYWDGDVSWVDIHDLTQLEKTVIKTTDDTITDSTTDAVADAMATDQDQVTFECDQSVVLPRYLMYLFQYATPQLERLSAGSTHDKIQLHFFSDLEIPLPSIDEQQKIVATLESVGDVATANREQLDSLERLKTGLRQDLLSGEVRTNGRNIAIPDEVTKYEPE